MPLRARLWGVRGSIPAPGPETVRYGGNTPCIEVRGPGGELLVLDAGTGIRGLGHALARASPFAPIRGDVLITHAHWDHIQGLPFFAPLFGESNRFTFWGSPALQARLDQVLRDQMAPEVFPVAFDELRARIDFRELGYEERAIAGCRVDSAPARHPGGSLAVRIAACNEAGGALVYIPDNELNPGVPYDGPADWRDRLAAFARGAAVLVHDTMYTAEEYEARRGWGHSTYDEAVGLAVDAGVGTLVLFHHRPERTDDELDRMVAYCRRLADARGAALNVVPAVEGSEFVM